MLEIGPGTTGIDSINIDLVMGDKTGYLHMQNAQTAFVEYSTYSVLRSAPPLNFRVDEGSSIWTSSDFKIIGQQLPAMQVIRVFLLEISYNKHIFCCKAFILQISILTSFLLSESVS